MFCTPLLRLLSQSVVVYMLAVGVVEGYSGMGVGVGVVGVRRRGE